MEVNLKKTNWLTRFQVITGLVLVAIPILSPIILSIIRLISIGRFQFDYLMPAELGLPVLIGAGMLLWAAIREQAYIKWIAWCLGIAVLLVFGGQGLALFTGLASGKIGTTGWQYGVVFASFIGYDIAVLCLVICGVVLCRRLFRVNNNNIQI